MQLERYNVLLDLLLSSHQAVLLTGNPGVGKSCLINVSIGAVTLHGSHLHKLPAEVQITVICD